MHFVYIDDSCERPRYIFSALCVPCNQWNEAFSRLQLWRKHLRDTHGIPTNYELHAQEFVSGRGTASTLGALNRHKRSQIFHKGVSITNWLNECGVTVFNVCSMEDDQFRAFERLLNRINRTMRARNSFAHLICDHGKEQQYTRLVRKMRVYNPIPSRYGTWAEGGGTRNIPIDRIIEDPQFKSSAKSYFIQQADFIAFSLLRRENPTPRIKKHGLHKTFDQLDVCLETVCNPNDPKGVIR